MKDLLKIVYEDEDVLVVNKSPGILVDRPLSEETSLSDLVASYAQRRVRPLHRLDRDTSGLVMFALNAKWNRYFSELFEKKRVRKAYWAIVKGDWDGQITKIDRNLAPASPGRFRFSKAFTLRQAPRYLRKTAAKTSTQELLLREIHFEVSRFY